MALSKMSTRMDSHIPQVNLILLNAASSSTNLLFWCCHSLPKSPVCGRNLPTVNIFPKFPEDRTKYVDFFINGQFLKASQVFPQTLGKSSFLTQK